MFCKVSFDCLQLKCIFYLCLFVIMVKCAAYNCRSGYARTKTDRSLLTVSAPVKRTCSVFRFPKDCTLRSRWLQALRRSDRAWNPDNCGICERHFQEDDFRQDTRRKTQRQRRSLKEDAVPSVFDCFG